MPVIQYNDYELVHLALPSKESKLLIYVSFSSGILQSLEETFFPNFL